MLQYWYVVPLALLLIGLCVAQGILKWRREKEAAKKEAAEREQRHADARVFRCLIPHQPITAAEQLHLNTIALGGAFRPLYREALAIGSDQGLEIETKDQFGAVVTITMIPWPEFSHFRTEQLSIKKQLRDSFYLGLAMGLMVFCVIMGLIIYKAGMGPFFEHPGRSFLVLLGLFVVSPLVGLLFSFVPNLFRLRSDLLQFVLHKADGSTLLLAADPSQQAKVSTVLGEFKLPRRE